MGFFRPEGEGPDDAASEAEVDDFDAADHDLDDASFDDDDDRSDLTDPGEG